MKFERVALASFPRSGNTWVRHLIYHTTGSGSYCIHSTETDKVHQAAHIPEITDVWSPFAKTHFCDTEGFDAVIHIVRNPLTAIASYKDYCSDFNVPTPEDFVSQEIDGWIRHYEYWRLAVISGAVRGLVIRYEDLVADPLRNMWGIIEFLEWPDITQEKVLEAVDKCSIENLRRNGGHKFFNEGINRDSRNSLSYDQRATILDSAFTQCRALGYMK